MELNLKILTVIFCSHFAHGCELLRARTIYLAALEGEKTIGLSIGQAPLMSLPLVIVVFCFSQPGSGRYMRRYHPHFQRKAETLGLYFCIEPFKENK